ncbi:hypothetical protein LZ554_001681 [Drepanopeziza brunnea f. sp. 'monogermtubi']|nr:hypothetical protein LZ554_001681 [Drepanopeziza brunnea f. sp. 'monogermtubi']
MKVVNLVLIIGACLGLSYASESPAKCLTPDPSPEFLAFDPLKRSVNNGVFSRQAQNLNVDVYFHIASTVANATKITEQRVADQFTVLQNSYLPYGIHLSLRNTSRVVDDLIGTGFYLPDATMGDDLFDQWLAWMQRTRQGSYASLNVYFYTDLPSGLMGACRLPSIVTPGDEFFYRDGCQIHAKTMPGGDDPKWQGHTAVHEVGHWFGLLHTFQGGCATVADGIADTPGQLSGSTGCPVGRDSCPDQPGLDPIHNFMDYSDDNCTTEFTPLQMERMHRYFASYRAGA